MEYQIEKPLDSSTKFADEFNKPIIQVNGRSLLFKGRINSSIIYKIFPNSIEKNITFYKFESNIFYKNLLLIDSDLPSIVTQLLFYKYRENESNLFKLTKILEEKNPLSYPKDFDRPYYSYKIKKMLCNMAMGMTAKTPWMGNFNSDNLSLVVRDDDKIIYYHVYDIQKFQNYLMKNTRLENPSMRDDKDNFGYAKPKDEGKSYNFGFPYKQDGEVFIRLNLQVGYSN